RHIKNPAAIFPIFSFLHLAIGKSTLINERDKILALHSKSYVNSYVSMTLRELAEILNLTHERVRQLTLPERIDSAFWEPIKSLISYLQGCRYNLTILDVALTGDIIFIDQGHVNEQNGTSFSLAFICRVISIIDKTYKAINIEKVTDSSFLIKEDL